MKPYAVDGALKNKQKNYLSNSYFELIVAFSPWGIVSVSTLFFLSLPKRF